MRQQASRQSRNIRPDTIVGLIALVVIIVLWAMSITQVRTPILVAAGLITHTHTPTITLTPTVTPTPTMTPTLMAISLDSEPFAEGETGIVLASFNDAQAGEVALQKSLYHTFEAHGLETLRLDKTIPDESQAELIGQQYRASAVVWGWDYGETKYVYVYIMPAIMTPEMLEAGTEYKGFMVAFDDVDYLVNFIAGMIAYNREDHITAIDFWDTAAELAEAAQYAEAEDDSSYYRRLDSLYFYRGTAHSFLEEHQAAIDDLTISLTLDPDDAHALYNRGLSYADLNHLPEALADYTAAIELNPDDTDFYRVRGDLHYRMHNDGAAAADYLRYEALTGRLDSRMAERLSEMGLR